jgi:hypothetical protein
MTPKDWLRFIETAHGREIAIAQVSEAIRIHLEASSEEASSEKVFIHHDYVLKAVEKHSIPPTDFDHLFDTIEFGIVLQDRDRHLVFLYQSRQGWFHVALKRAESSRRIYVSTFHRTTEAKVIAKLRRHPIIRK